MNMLHISCSKLTSSIQKKTKDEIEVERDRDTHTHRQELGNSTRHADKGICAALDQWHGCEMQCR